MVLETLRSKQRLDHKRMVGFLAITIPYRLFTSLSVPKIQQPRVHFYYTGP